MSNLGPGKGENSLFFSLSHVSFHTFQVIRGDNYLLPLRVIPHTLKSRGGGGVRGTAAAAAKSLQSCPTRCNPIDGSPPDSSVPGILQARTLEWVAEHVKLEKCLHPVHHHIPTCWVRWLSADMEVISLPGNLEASPVAVL